MNHSGFEYEVEGDVDFFSQLKQMTQPSPTDANTNATTPRCLITDEILRRDHITLHCGHKFNYVPLFKEVLFQKCVLLPKNLSSNIITTYTTTAAAAVATDHQPLPQWRQLIITSIITRPFQQTSPQHPALFLLCITLRII